MTKTRSNKRRKIMVVDDDSAIVDILTLMLEDADYEVSTSTRGQTLRKIKRELPDLILLDRWLSGEDGGEICKDLKRDDMTQGIPVIMISATRDIGEISRKVGAEDFLAKPFQMNELFTKIEKHIRT